MAPTSKEDTGMIVIGIDPGSSGAIVRLNSYPMVPTIWRMPTMTKRVNGKNRTEVDGVALGEIFKEIDSEEWHECVVEHLWPWAKDTSLTAWSLSGRYQRILQTMDVLGMEYNLVAPVRWKGKVIGPKQKWVKNKEASITYCKEEYPEWPLRTGRQTTDQDGIADAYCLALYGRRELR